MHYQFIHAKNPEQQRFNLSNRCNLRFIFSCRAAELCLSHLCNLWTIKTKKRHQAFLSLKAFSMLVRSSEKERSIFMRCSTCRQLWMTVL